MVRSIRGHYLHGSKHICAGYAMWTICIALSSMFMSERYQDIVDTVQHTQQKQSPAQRKRGARILQIRRTWMLQLLQDGRD